MVERLLDATGHPVSPISFGAFKIGRNEGIKYPAGYALPTDAETERLLNGVLDLGINLIDTAPAYGTSEERIGRCIAHRRKEFLLSTKVGETFESGRSSYDFSRDAIARSIERSLDRLRTDVLDLVFIHSDGSDLQILEHTDAVPTLLDLRRRGLIRGIGLSGKTIAGARAALAWADALMLEHHPADRTFELILAEAGAGGISLLVKKPLASGNISPEVALPFILENPHVSSVVLGSLNLDHLRQALDIARRVRP
ncbi:MAG TPA: aldo/keto reductase [Phycisphaerae bacterium]|jgi:aryl-alcohol dehydrogenase-like predicted oxidoreductase